MKTIIKLSILLLTLIVSSTATAEEIEVDGIVYEFHDESANATVKYRFFQYSGNVVIPAFVNYNGMTYSVTSIAYRAFYNCTGLTSIEFPSSITRVGSQAFEGCSALTSVRITDLAAWCKINFESYLSNPLQITHHLYLNGTEVNNLIIPDSVTAIGTSAFSGCTGLISVTIPNSVTAIGTSAFSGCTGLTSVTIPNSVTSIGSYAFQGCTSLATLHFNAISCHDFYSNSPFKDLNVSTVIIGDGVRYIPAYFANGLTNLTTITIPNSVDSIGCFAFHGCTSLATLNFNAISCADFRLDIDASYNYSYPPFYNLNISTINIGSNVQRIPAYFLYGMTESTSINIPNSVTEIGSLAFAKCSGLTCVTLPNTITDIGHAAFSECSSLTYVNIPNSVTKIGIRAFENCSSLTDINIPNSVTRIEEGAFHYCI